jgi:hypothetical protein
MSLAVRKATAKGAIAVVNDSMCDIVRFVNETTQGVEDYDVQLKKRKTFTHFTCTTEDPETGMKKIAEVHSCIRTEHTLKSQTKAIMEAGASAAETGGQILGDVKQYVAAQVCMATSKTMTGVTSTSRKIGVGAVVTFGGACNFLKRSFVTACKVGLMIADDADANKRARVHDASGDSASGGSASAAKLNQERNDQQSDDGIEQGEASASGDSASGDSASGDSASGDSASGDSASGDSASGDSASGDSASGDSASGDSASGDSASGDSASGDSASGDSASGDSASGGSASAANASAANASAANASAAAGMSVESLINSDSAANASGH